MQKNLASLLLTGSCALMTCVPCLAKTPAASTKAPTKAVCAKKQNKIAKTNTVQKTSSTASIKKSK